MRRVGMFGDTCLGPRFNSQVENLASIGNIWFFVFSF